MKIKSTPSIAAKQISEICQHPSYGNFLRILKQKDESQATRAVEPAKAAPNTLVFASTPVQLDLALKGQPSILILLDKLTKQPIEFDGALYATPSMPAAMALVLPLLDQKDLRFSPGIHPTAVIDPSAHIGKGVHLGAYVIVGPQAQIGDGCKIGAHTVIEREAKVGAGTILHPHVFIGARCELGNNCEIHPHSTIGADGFGFVQSPDQKRIKIPQLGTVILEDSVEIGANCAVDRATLGETRIGAGSKFDNLCHIAHNCTIGKNNVFAANFSIAGSSHIGDNCTFGGSVAISDHVSIGSSIIIGGRAGIMKDVLEPGAYTGFPLEPFKDGIRTLSSLPHLTNLRKQVAQIRKHLGMKEEP
jgi:UDP-3-O-[3-hydroxymyristoyl] glucosamine N-acyltransferase